ncbi:MAG: hypothetical protein HQL95_13950 [Magnetococcales bacterium]|nr:hypothetical protein [Magnetococcales bacterium]
MTRPSAPPEYREFDCQRLRLRPLAERRHDLDLGVLLPLELRPVEHEALRIVARRLLEARGRGAATVLMLGGHVPRSGVQRYLLDWFEQGLITGMAVNGAVVIHDFELALVGGTTESVARYIRDGQFGMWQETGRLNDIVTHAARSGLGLGEAVGREIALGDYPHKETSLLAGAWQNGVVATVHVGIGHDITHPHPNCDGAAYGATSQRDFLRLAALLENLEGGVVMNFGSAVMAPEVYLKALSMVRNVAAVEGRSINRFTTLVCDLKPLPATVRAEPGRENPDYYFRPWKTMLARTVADGGEGYYVQGRHDQTIPQLWSALREDGT